MNCIILSVGIIALTFSFTIITFPLAGIFEKLPYLSAIRWALLFWSVITIYAFKIFSGKTLISSLFEKPREKNWRISGLIMLFMYLVTTPITIIFPSPRHSPIDMITIVSIGPIAEEFLFRGIIWELIIKYLKRTKPILKCSPVLLITSILFGIMHWQYLGFQLSKEVLLTILFTGTMGFVFGKIRKESQTLSLGILAHILFNALWNLFLRTNLVENILK